MRTKEVTYRIMSAIKSKNTRPERVLGTAMWHLGLRYRKHYRMRGRPDFVFVKSKIAVFCDGDFWHGNNWALRGLKNLKEELKQYDSFWATKIKTNVKRDQKVNKMLKEAGWIIVRFWESEILKNPGKCAQNVVRTIKRLQQV
jgi:DNA mismatch endonuclease (patch repair protein)